MIGGIDEAGRGPVIGPMTVAGVAVEDEAYLMEIGVKDSKKILPHKRAELAQIIKDNYKTETVVVPAVEIDTLRTQMTMNQMEVYIFIKVGQALSVADLFVDAADANEVQFGAKIAAKIPGTRVISRHKGDDLFPVVSAASIIAKNRRDTEVEAISQELGIDIGSGYPSDPKTIDFMKKWIADNGELPPYTRKSWATATRLMGELKQTTLDGL